MGEPYDWGDENRDWEEPPDYPLRARMTALCVLIGLAAGCLVFAITLVVQWLTAR